jgi:hypothetical protein
VFWTFLAAIRQFKVDRNVRQLLYFAYLDVNYQNEFVTRVRQGGKWFDGQFHDPLKCIDPLCESKTSVASGAMFSKLCFEYWLEKHFQKEHHRSFLVYLHANCKHVKTRKDTLFGWGAVDSYTESFVYCTDCGKLMHRRPEC